MGFAHARHWAISDGERSGKDDARASASDDEVEVADEADRGGSGKADSSNSRAIGGGATPNAPMTSAVSMRLTNRR